MPVRPATALAAGLAEGLSGIHAAGVVHCDLKPSNVLLSQDGPRVIDFGIARAAEAAPSACLVVGSPGFMSPEQATGGEIGPASDIFSLGAVLTFAATGGGPFGRGSSPELAYRLVYDPPDLGMLPAELRPLVEGCLAKDPGQRPTADEVLAAASALQPATGWLPGAALSTFAPYVTPKPAVTAAPPAGAGRWRRWWRPLTAAGVTAALVVASVAVSFALSGTPRNSPRTVPRAAATLPPPPVISATHPAAPRPSGPAPRPAIIPVVRTVTSPGSASPSPVTTPSSASPSPSPSPTASGSPTPTTSPSALPVPQITSVGTYQQGTWVYFDVHYADPGNDAQGFGFIGVNGFHPVAETYPFASPGRGVAAPGSIAYPLGLECGTAEQHTAEVEAWIYDTAGARSEPVMIHLACQPDPNNLAQA